MLYYYDLSQVEPTDGLVEEGLESVFSLFRLSREDVTEMFHEEAEIRIAEQVIEVNEGLTNEEQEELFNEAVEADREEVAFEISKEYVEALTFELDALQDRIDETRDDLNQ